MKKLLRHKYGAISCERDSIKFPSKLERACYDYLKELQNAGSIRMFLRQIRFDLLGGGKHIVDYCLFTEENVVFIEAKGRDLPLGKLKRKSAEALYDVDIHIAKKVSDIDDILKKVKND